MASTSARLTREAMALIDRASALASRLEIAHQIFATLERVIGFDTAILLPLNGEPAFFLGKSHEQIVFWQRHAEHYVPDVVSLANAARKADHVVLDREVYSARERDRLAMYAEYLRPYCVDSSLVAFMAAGQRYTHVLALGRRRRSTEFCGRHAETLRRLHGTLALTTRLAWSTAGEHGSAGGLETFARLSPREREVCQLLSRGLRNAEIAAVVGTSINTVRNQLASIFRKLEVTTRAELAARFSASPLVAGA
jgi:DNA-binding CsgD family transcriptional regulator